MSLDEHSEFETKAIALKLLRDISDEIGEEFASLAFPNTLSRENAEITLTHLPDDFLFHLFKTNTPKTSYPSILSNPNKFKAVVKGELLREAKLFQTRILRLNLQNRLIGHTRSIHFLEFNRMGDSMYTGSDDTNIKVWHLPSQSLIITLRGHGDVISGMSISPDGKILVSVAADQSLRIWNLLTGACVAFLDVSELSEFSHLCFSPCNRYLAVAGSSGTYLIYEISILSNSLRSLKTQLDSNLSSFKSQNALNMDNTSDIFPDYDPTEFLKHPPHIMKQHKFKDPITFTAFSPGGCLFLVGSENGLMNIVTLSNNRIWKVQAHDNPIDGARFLQNSFRQVLTWSRKGGELKLWLIGEKMKLLQTFLVRGQQRRSHLVGVSISVNESYIFAITSAALFVFRLNSPTPILHIDEQTAIVSIDAHPKVPNIFLVASKAKVLVYNVHSPIPIRTLDIPFETPRIQFAKWTPSGLSIAASDAGGGVYMFRVADSIACHQFYQFFPTDFLASEWVPNFGQVDEGTKSLTHLQDRSILIDSNHINQITQYCPVSLSDVSYSHVIDSSLQNTWLCEELWLLSLKNSSSVPDEPQSANEPVEEEEEEKENEASNSEAQEGSISSQSSNGTESEESD